MMGDSSRSPKRRNILSSINPEESRKRRRHRSHECHGEAETVTSSKDKTSLPEQERFEDQDGASEATRPRSSRLKLKDHKSRRRSSRDRHRDDSHRSDRHHRRHRRRSRSPTPTDPYRPSGLDPDAAFRESLFDAMADDEGASYWEGVYGQPVHVYPTEKVGPTGELEQMTEEEYASYVRQKMWEKTHAGLIEEREKRQRERERKEKEAQSNRKLQDEMEDSLRRGEERRERRKWTDRETTYSTAWANWDGTPEKLDWPVESGSRDDIGEKSVRHFFMKVFGLNETGDKTPVMAKLKDERIRWHPDKIQQRLGGRVDDEIIRDVTAVFQIIDKIWADTRKK